ncbi:multidrug effflux MFS transporter [Aquamicrobium sp. LC103]|uniref:multidrug effflux MFS transporter n=1 Tax=Aquamicrobium sp. LC103 TaxID=1120658 RepID=UPI00063EB0B5|nr:multidrug effflux MFS transporter [Aquamicrobium sp. LC103]TKT76903.1 multidrug effflux MFS transporter [Aquamicrobium sp. LC103]
MQKNVEPRQAAHSIPKYEFIALTAALMALNALAIDIMLPALQQIGGSLGVADENSRQYVITAYVTGFGLAQLFFGPLSDRFGRRRPLLAGIVVYVVAAFACALSPSFGALLVMRFIQGLGAAATRVIAVSVVRDTFGGRAMAEVMSLVFMVFMIIPVIAPGVGQVIILFSEWPMIFVFMGVVSALILLWTWMRLPETMHEEYRRPLTISAITDGFRTVLTNRISICYTVGLTFMFGALFGFINSAQQIYIGIYDVGAWFPVLFAAVAGLMAMSSFLNSRLVGRFGMRRMAHGALLGFLTITGIAFAISLAGPMPLWLFTSLFALAMMQFSWIGSNFNSLAMEPLGHVAGTASSVQGFIQTVGGGIIGASIGQAFNGTITPLAAGYFFGALAGLTLVLLAEKGKLFQVHNKPV